MTVLYFQCHIRLGRRKTWHFLAAVPREEVGSKLRCNRTHREEVAGPKLVFGGGDTREEVGVAAFPMI